MPIAISYTPDTKMAAEDSRSFDAPRNSSTSGANDHVVTVSEESEGKNKCTACGMLVRGHLGQCGSAKCLYGLVFKLSARVEDLEKAGRVRQDELESSESLSSERQNGLLETIRLQQERIDELEKKIERLASEKEASETPLQTTVSVEDTEDRTPTSTPPPTKDDTMSYSEATCPRERTQSEGSFIPAKSRGSRRKPTVSQASNQKIDNENKPPQHGKCPRVGNGAHVTNQMRPPVNGQSPQILARPRIQRDFRPLPLKISCLLYRTEKIKRSEWYSTWVI